MTERKNIIFNILIFRYMLFLIKLYFFYFKIILILIDILKINFYIKLFLKIIF